MIKPTIGRVVWYYDHGMNSHKDQPYAAIVCYVHGDDQHVNLVVFDIYGAARGKHQIQLIQDGEPVPERGNYCCWMPYQIGQAKKTEEVMETARNIAYTLSQGANK